MHQLSIYLLSIGTLFVFMNVRSAPTSKSISSEIDFYPQEDSMPHRQEGRWNRHSNDNSEDHADDADWEDIVCKEAFKFVIEQRDKIKFDAKLIQLYCPHFDASLLLTQEGNDAHKQNNKPNYLYDVDDDVDREKKQALRRRQLNKRIAFGFIHNHG